MMRTHVNLPNVREWVRDRSIGDGLALLVLAVYVKMAVQLIAERASSDTIYQMDFAIFRQTGKLAGSGQFDQVYRYIPPGSTSAGYPAIWSEYFVHRSGYYYAQAPWHAIMMIPFHWLPYQAGYVLWASIMALCLIGAGILIWRYTIHGGYWTAVLLATPFVAPFLVGDPWGDSGFTWHWIGSGGPLKWETILGATLWYGQYTPLILLFLTGAFVSAHTHRHRVAGLLLVLATMKPNVLFGVPLILLVSDDWIDLIRWTVFWALVCNIVFMSIPSLGYPLKFAEVTFSYTEVFWPIILQAHNYVWMLGILVVTIALHIDGENDVSVRKTVRSEVDHIRHQIESLKLN